MKMRRGLLWQPNCYFEKSNMRLQADGITGKRILLVEDERVVREALRLMLLRDAHLVIEANNGVEAFALFLSTKFDLVLTDFEMPFANGDELAAKIKRVAPRQPILMITAFDRKPSLGNPVDAVLNKLFNSEQLRDTMTRLFSRLGENARSVEGNRIGSEDEAVIPSRNL
jgi:YesN/AraC family two-component response regulator